jgi:alpha-glucosidase
MSAQNEIKLVSPNSSIIYQFKILNGVPEYQISFKDKILINYSSLTLSFLKENVLGKEFKIGKPIFKNGEDNYSLITGKTNEVHDVYKEVLIPLAENGSLNRIINLRVRLFNDGLAFRYEFPKQKNWQSYTLTDEKTTFNLAGDPTLVTLFLPNFTTSHEGRYNTLPFSRIKTDTLMDMPTLLEFAGNIYMAITEAELVDYAGMYLIKKDGILKSQLSPLPGKNLIKVKAQLPHKTPWRVLLISDKIGSLIESNIITSLNEPCKIKDVSVIKPGKTDFHWWNGDVSPDTTFAPGINFDFNKYYIDFCSENNIQYHTIIGYGGIAWYKNDGESYAPGPHSDVTKSISGLDMKKICDYAKEKNVGIRVWVHWKVLYPELEKAFTQFEEWGIKGMMVDFLDRDDQEMVNIQVRILKEAAKHHLHIQFHGAYKPTGLNRTYPNEFTREGTLNYENDKWGNIITPDDDINIPFTRGLAGSTDYHLGGFRAVPESKFKPQYTRPLVVGTRCHMLAMYVVLLNYLQMVCDYPEAYAGQPGFEFIKEIPTTWDETKVIDAKVGEWLSIARRKNNDWYVGTITNNSKRKAQLNFSFLPEGLFNAEMYTDAPDDNFNPNHLVKEVIKINNKDTISVNLADGGGLVMHIYPDLSK